MQQVIVSFTVDSPDQAQARENIDAMLWFAGVGSFHVVEHGFVDGVIDGSMMDEEIPQWVNEGGKAAL